MRLKAAIMGLILRKFALIPDRGTSPLKSADVCPYRAMAISSFNKSELINKNLIVRD
jgi:hypothetical protein